MAKFEFPARIHVLLARDAPVGLVIRRGPSKRVATILWDLERDEFQLGQWLKGRIFERRSDLSPDGRYFIYFAMNGKWSAEAKGSWTAISRTPYLKALALFPKGNCWHGGGLWTGKTNYWLNDGYGHSILTDTTEVRRDKRFEPEELFNNECLGIYYPWLIRNGWEYVERVEIARHQARDILEKPLSFGWRLRKIAHAEINSPAGKGCYWDEHQLVHTRSSKEINCSDWEWADYDHHRLLWAVEGKLYASELNTDGLTGSTELFDFNPMHFQAIKAPY